MCKVVANQLCTKPRIVCRMCKGAVAGLSILMAMTWSMSKTYSSALDHPTTYLTNALFPVFICILSSYFVAELWGQVSPASANRGFYNRNHGQAKPLKYLIVDFCLFSMTVGEVEAASVGSSWHQLL